MMRNGAARRRVERGVGKLRLARRSVSFVRFIRAATEGKRDQVGACDGKGMS